MEVQDPAKDKFEINADAQKTNSGESTPIATTQMPSYKTGNPDVKSLFLRFMAKATGCLLVGCGGVSSLSYKALETGVLGVGKFTGVLSEQFLGVLKGL